MTKVHLQTQQSVCLNLFLCDWLNQQENKFAGDSICSYRQKTSTSAWNGTRARAAFQGTGAGCVFQLEEGADLALIRPNDWQEPERAQDWIMCCIINGGPVEAGWSGDLRGGGGVVGGLRWKVSFETINSVPA